MKLPKHIALYIEHNDHACVYSTVAQACADYEIQDDEWVSVEQKEKALRTNEVWTCQWYPMTPVGFCLLRAADLDSLMDALARIAEEEAA